ncbi:MAG: hypothetical protein AVDCRST_MAG41-2851, partial [uncultured Corynebacteriales bacterium]
DPREPAGRDRVWRRCRSCWTGDRPHADVGPTAAAAVVARLRGVRGGNGGHRSGLVPEHVDLRDRVGGRVPARHSRSSGCDPTRAQGPALPAPGRV